MTWVRTYWLWVGIPLAWLGLSVVLGMLIGRVIYLLERNGGTQG